MTSLEALRRTLVLVRRSEDSTWAGTSSRDTAEVLAGAIAAVEAGRRPDWFALSRLFLPTASIQEIAIDNGWGDEFILLASIVDAAAQRR